MTMSPGKFRGMQRLAAPNGTLKMLAVDQRTPILGPIAAARGRAEAPYEDVAAFKELLVRHLASEASAVLVDPIYGFPRALPLIGRETGLMLTLEHSFVDVTAGGKKTRSIPGWSVEKIRKAGGEAVKILVWYRSDAPEVVKEHQLEYVRQIGEACRRHDIVHLLELLVYPLPDEDPARYEASRSQLVQECVRDFRGPEFAVDIYKLEPPSKLADVPDPHGPEASAVQRAYDAMARELPAPWVLLSAGAGPEDFMRSLVYAYRAGASGYLCGRAVWQNAFEKFPDFAAMETELRERSLGHLKRINTLTEAEALPWHAHSRYSGGVSFDERPDFPERYADRRAEVAT